MFRQEVILIKRLMFMMAACMPEHNLFNLLLMEDIHTIIPQIHNYMAILFLLETSN